MTNTNTAPVYTADNLTNDDINGAYSAGLVSDELFEQALGITRAFRALATDEQIVEARTQIAAALNASLPAGASRKTPLGFAP